MEIKLVDDQTRQDHCEIIANLKKTRDRIVPRLLANKAFYDGDHFTMGEIDSAGNVKKISSAKPYREIPLATDQINGMRNMLLSSKPAPFIYPDDRTYTDEELSNPNLAQQVDDSMKRWSQATEYLLDEEIKLKNVQKTLIKYGLLYSTAFLQVYTENGKYKMEALDPFEVSIYPTIKKIGDYPYLVKHIAKPLKALKNSKNFTKEEFKNLEERLQENNYFEEMQKNTTYGAKFGYADPKTVVIDELYALEEKGLAIYSYIGTELIKAQSPEETKLKNFMFEMFLTGEEPFEKAPIETFIPLNRALDILITKLERRVRRLDGGRIALHKSEAIKVVSTADGEFVRWKKFRPEIMPEENYPSTLINLIGIFRDLFSQLGVNAAVSSAGIPNGVEAWRAIESLKQADYGKMEIYRQNLEECLTGATERLVELISVTEITPRNIIIPTTKNAISIVGSAGKELADENTLVFDPQKRLKVVIESGLTHTPEAKREAILNYVQMGLLSKEHGIEMLKLGNTRDILNKLMMEQVQGQSMVDMPDFQALPERLKMAIVMYLKGGADPAVKEALDGKATNVMYKF